MKIAANTSKNNLFIRFMISYIWIFILTMLICIMGYFVAFDIVEKDIKDANMAMLNQSKNIIDQKLSIVSIAARQIATNPRITDIMDTYETDPKFSYLDLQKVVDELASYKLNLDRDFIYDYYVYSKKSKYLVTPETVYKADFYFNNVLKSIDMSFSCWNDKVLNREHDRNGEYYKESLMQFAHYNSFSIIMYAQSIPLSFNRSSCGSLVFLLDKKSINSLLSSIDISQGGYIYIQDKQGNVITTITKNNEKIEYLDLKKHTSPEGFFRQSVGNKNMIINYTTSSDNGFKYVLVLPERIVMNKLNSFRRFIVTIFFAALIIGISIACIMAYHNSKPVNNILKYIKEAVGGEESKDIKDAFNTINNTISSLINSNKALQEKITEQKPMLINAYADRLLKGEFNNKNELIANASYIGLNPGMEHCLVLVLRIYGRNDINEINEEIVNELNTAKVLLRDAFMKYMGKNILCHDIGPQTMAAIVYPDNGFDCKEKVTSMVDSIFDEFHTMYSLKMLFGIGSVYKSSLEAWISYQEALETLDYIQLHTGKKKMWYDEIPKEALMFYYPIDLEERMINYVKIGDIDQVKNIFSIVINENYTNRKISESMSRQLFYEIKGTLMKLMQQVPENADLFEQLKKLNYEKNYDNNFERLLLMLERLCKCVTEHRNDRNTCVINSIKKYIEENYMNQELGLSLVASEFHFSEGYLSYFFKEQSGSNFIDYVEQVRMEKAYELLKNTDLSIDEISKETGYNNVKTFRRAFKRINGVSPSAMRM